MPNYGRETKQNETKETEQKIEKEREEKLNLNDAATKLMHRDATIIDSSSFCVFCRFGTKEQNSDKNLISNFRAIPAIHRVVWLLRNETKLDREIHRRRRLTSPSIG